MINFNEGYEDFDWSTLSKNELDQLYNSIIDNALTNKRYLWFVLSVWKIDHYQFYDLAVKNHNKRVEQRKKQDRYRLTIAKGILKYCEEFPGDPDETYQILRDQALNIYKNKN